MGDCYRSLSGIIPVRWTAQEGTDVLSYGTPCVKAFQFAKTTTARHCVTIVRVLRLIGTGEGRL